MVVHPDNDDPCHRATAAANGLGYRIDTRTPKGGPWVLNTDLTYDAFTNLESYRPRRPGDPLIRSRRGE
jgi:hypothetical protein